jgi:hypothetical protein
MALAGHTQVRLDIPMSRGDVPYPHFPVLPTHHKRGNHLLVTLVYQPSYPRKDHMPISNAYGLLPLSKVPITCMPKLSPYNHRGIVAFWSPSFIQRKAAVRRPHLL